MALIYNKEAKLEVDRLIKLIRKKAKRYRNEHGLREFSHWERKNGIGVPVSRTGYED
jgi:hypothetical protein